LERIAYFEKIGKPLKVENKSNSNGKNLAKRSQGYNAFSCGQQCLLIFTIFLK